MASPPPAGESGHARVKDVFLAAVELPSPTHRAVFLKEACAGDDRLRSRVEALLAAHGRPERLLDASPLALEPTPLDEFADDSHFDDDRIGTMIGPYRLMESIGQGGMGVVYVAEQSAPVRRRVALKLIRPGMDTKQFIARFEAERQALAMMDHPNIARVLDAGTAQGGRPYFVMELVRGVPITEYCDAERLTVAQRLELFVLVCRAVQHAHQKGIIHRDLKPSNILVTHIDGAAVPKVIDFGVAKAVGASLTDRTLYTAFHQFVGTPMYMSPEQAGLSSVDVDTRSDVYALGVLLYELLTGATPFDASTFRKAALDQMMRMIREADPMRPSTRVGTLGESLSTVSQQRRIDPRRLGPALRGELDWVVMKALEKDRSRRYQTANEFADDVMRQLADRPVQARPPSRRYRLAKHARRNRAAWLATMLVATTLLAGAGVSAWQAVRATKAEQDATAALEDSHLVIDYLVKDVFGAAAPEKTRGKTLDVHDLLAAGESALPQRFGRRPLVEAAAREALGRANFDLGRYEEARVHFRRAVLLRAENLGVDHLDTLATETLAVHALCPPAVVLVSKPDEAEPIARRVLDSYRRTLGPRRPLTLSAMATLAHVLRIKRNQNTNADPRLDARGRLSDAIVLAEGAVAMAEARELAETALAEQTRQLGAEHVETLRTLDVLGSVLYLSGDFPRSEAAIRAAAEGRRRVLGPDHPATLQSFRHLPGVLQRLGREDEAVLLLIDVVQGYRQTFGPIHLQTSSPVGALMEAYEGRDPDALREFCERSIREIQATPADPDPYLRDRRSIMLQRFALKLATAFVPERFDRELADGAVVEALNLAPDWYSSMALGAFRCRVGRLDEALQALRTSAEQPNWADRQNDFYWFALAATHARRGDLVEAAACYERGRNHPDRPDSWQDIVKGFRDDAADRLGLPPSER